MNIEAGALTIYCLINQVAEKTPAGVHKLNKHLELPLLASVKTDPAVSATKRTTLLFATKRLDLQTDIQVLRGFPQVYCECGFRI